MEAQELIASLSLRSVGGGEYRLPTGGSTPCCNSSEGDNPGFSFAADDGKWYCHRCQEGGGIGALAKMAGLNGSSRTDLGRAKQTPKRRDFNPSKTYEKAKQGPAEKSLILRYLAGRAIQLTEAQQAVLWESGVRVWRWTGKEGGAKPGDHTEIIYPIHGASGNLVAVGRIEIDPLTGAKRDKSTGGKPDEDRAFVLDPNPDVQDGGKLAVAMEGFEDALSVWAARDGADSTPRAYVVTSGSGWAAHTGAILSRYAKASFLCDPDPINPEKGKPLPSLRAALKLQEAAPALNILIPRLGDRIDANKAQQDGRIADWFKSLSPPKPHEIEAAQGAATSDVPTAGTDPETALEEMNRRHALVVMGGQQTAIIERDDGSRDWWKPAALKAYYAGRVVQTGTDDKGHPKFENRAAWWMQHPKRRQYDRIGFWPQLETPAGAFNLWRGLSVEPKPGDWSLFRAHLKENIAQGEAHIFDYLLGWMAHAVQRPWELPETAIALKGKQGTGKSKTWETFGRLFGSHFIMVDRPEKLAGQFNHHLSDKVVVFADEAFFSGDKAAVGALKSRITSQHLAFESKGRDVVTLPNYSRVVVASNEKWVVPAALDERRWCLFEVGNGRAKDAAYFGEMDRQLKAGGLAAFLHDLLALDLSNFDIRQTPQTDALRENKQASMDPPVAWWHEKLMRGYIYESDPSWPGRAYCGELLADLKDYAKNHPRRVQISSTVMGSTIRELCNVTSKPMRSDVDYSKTIRGYELPPLHEARARFEAATGSPWDWPPIDE